MNVTINEKRYRIEFSYRRRAGKRATLARDSPIQGLTGCAIVSDDSPLVVSVAAVVCSANDNWSRREGRKRAFERALHDCGILREQQTAFLIWFSQRFPDRTKRLGKSPRLRLSPQEVERRKQIGRARKAAESRFSGLRRKRPPDNGAPCPKGEEQTDG